MKRHDRGKQCSEELVDRLSSDGRPLQLMDDCRGATERAASEIEVRGSRHKEGVMFDKAAMQLGEDGVN